MRQPFALEWLGGRAEARLRKRRPQHADLPWGTFSPCSIELVELDQVRRAWTNGAFTEYASAAAFSSLVSLLLECCAPVDLIAVAADCVVDEMTHAELASRLVMELGGACPFEADLTKLAPATTVGARPLLRAAELAVKVSMVGETLSVGALSAARRAPGHPLISLVLERILQDESVHAQIGHWFFEWAHPLLDAADRVHLGEVARAAIAVYAPLWETAPPDGGGETHAGAYQSVLRETVDRRIVPSLSRWDIDARQERRCDEARYD